MPFVAEREFIIATRETGYRTTSSAVAELLDNALQAGARIVHVCTQNFTRTGSDAQPEVAVVDDGCGMDPTTLQLALRFGGTGRFDDRAGLGRFGMGLPNSSVSQARRVDVYSWRTPREVFHTYFDVDEIATGALTDVPSPRQSSVPQWVSRSLSPSGTAVIWSKCDRLSDRRVSSFRERLGLAIGRSFRYFIWDGAKVLIDDEPVRPIDPLFRVIDGTLEHSAADVGPPLSFELAHPKESGASSKIQVRFALLPVRAWSELAVEEKRRLGVSKGAGVSVVRAGREIAYGWHFMGQKRKENYDDWWRCEIRFDPELDEIFGVTHSKQGIRPSKEIEEILSPALEAVAHELNRRVRKEFLALKSTEVKTAAEVAKAKDRLLAPLKRGVPLGAKNGASIDYRVSARAMSQNRFFTSAVTKGRISLTLNKKHPFFGVYASNADRHSANDVKFAVDCLLFAIARAEHSAKSKMQREALRSCIGAWSDNLAAFLRK